MPDKEIVINTGPMIALIAATGNLNILKTGLLVDQPITLSPILKNVLDAGEASVIQYALDNQIGTVCIDEVAGRRIARLHDLNVTGSLGVLLKAKSEGFDISIRHCINNMRKNGIYLSSELVSKAILIAGE